MNAIAKIGDFGGGDAAFSPDYSQRIETLVQHRDRALELYAQAYDLNQLAHEEKRLAAPFNQYSQGLDHKFAGDPGHVAGSSERTEADRAREKEKHRAKYLEEVRKSVDKAVWLQVICETPLEKLMDTQARNDLHSQIDTNPLPVTVDDVLATMRSLVLDADKIFRRGLVESFRHLDRYYKSNDAFRIKHRFVMSSACSSDKIWDPGLRWNYHNDGSRRIHDIERCFRILDGQGEWTECSMVHLIEANWREKRYDAEGPYMRTVSYKNGNMHVWFLRKDLVAKANRIIADHFGACLADNTHTANPLDRKKRAKHAPDLGDFQSPPAVVKRVLELAEIKKDMMVLEPSAGVGNLALAAAELGASVECYEIDVTRAAALIYAGKLDLVRHEDFMEGEEEWRDNNQYDRVIMNPPFANDAAILHVNRALKRLKKGGKLVAVMPASVKFRNDKTYQGFRDLMASNAGAIEDLPAGSFKSAGTNVETVIVTMTKRGW